MPAFNSNSTHWKRFDSSVTVSRRPSCLSLSIERGRASRPVEVLEYRMVFASGPVEVLEQGERHVPFVAIGTGQASFLLLRRGDVASVYKFKFKFLEY